MEILPDYQIGFRRVLHGIYTHTSAHIVAAPMAHHMALHGSRFRYSHDHAFLPAHGLLQMHDDEKMIMRFRNTGTKQVAFHAAMNYMYRPLEFRRMCCFRFCRELMVTTKAQAKKQVAETYDFVEEHPFSSSDCIIYRDKHCVPVVTWNWLGSTSGFKSSLLSPINKAHSDYGAKETHAKRFLILFFPHDSSDSLQIEGSYQAMFQKAMRDNIIEPEMLEIAENIQTIHNSLNSAMPENILSANTEMVELDSENPEVPSEDDGMEAMLLSIGSHLASTSDGGKRTEECNDLNPTIFPITHSESDSTASRPEACFDLFDVIEETGNAADTDNSAMDNDAPNHFRATTSQLNTLCLSKFLVEKEADDSQNFSGGDEEWNDMFDRLVAYKNEHGDCKVPSDFVTNNKQLSEWVQLQRKQMKQKTLTYERKAKLDFIGFVWLEYVAVATGTWQSVVTWGKLAKLDPQQQTAFEILVATYILTFHEDWDDDIPANPNLIDQTKSLKKLARRPLDDTEDKPLRLFVTGPAGAGKSKSHKWL